MPEGVSEGGGLYLTVYPESREFYDNDSLISLIGNLAIYSLLACDSLVHPLCFPIRLKMISAEV